MHSALEMSVFLVGTFAAACVIGLAGFVFGLIAAAIWLHALTPVETTTLIVAYALIVQGHAVWRLRSAFDARRHERSFQSERFGAPRAQAFA